MAHEMEALARRAVACKHWRWMRGMSGRWASGDRWWPFMVHGVGVGGSIKAVLWRPAEAPNPKDMPGLSLASIGSTYRCEPDLTDPATLGCLRELVREAHGLDFVELTCDPVSQDVLARGVSFSLGEIQIYCGHDPLFREAEVLVDALENAP